MKKEISTVSKTLISVLYNTKIFKVIIQFSSGEVFAGGQILNTPAMVGRQCAKQTQKDKNLLAGLGVVTIAAPSNVHCKNKVDRLLADTPGSRLMNDTAFFQPGNGKLTFRSHLTVSERAAVKKVASGNFGVSERFI